MNFVDFRRSDIVLAVLVLAITAMLLIPLPTALLDLLLAINLAFSLLLLLVGLYMPNALALLAFPALLLLTTLFRLGLNVASTRLILSQADAGVVIRSFGTFLIRGDLLVGAIIFLIITVVNFVVITRGSSRVSEVAARFALDALPGKQMAIDSELRSGLLSAEEAKHKREELRKESQLYGAMDGAMKFVQGDVIAGLFITMTNIFGGLYQGVTQGQSLVDALSTYTVLTIGDGLVSQIPALLISICAGIIVTRVSSGENTTLGSDVGEQLFARPGALLVSGTLLAFLGLLPGLPSLPFVVVGIAICFGSLLFYRATRSGQEDGSDSIEQKQSFPPAEGVLDRSAAGKKKELRLFLDERQLYGQYRGALAYYKQWWHLFQLDFYNETGLRLPDLRVVADKSLPLGGSSVYLGNGPVFKYQVPNDCVLVEINPLSAKLFGLTVVREQVHPFSSGNVFWATREPKNMAILEAVAIRYWDFFQFNMLQAACLLRRNPEQLISVTDLHLLLKQIEQKYPGLNEQIFKENFITVPRLTALLQELARQDLSIADFEQILELTASWSSGLDLATIREDEFDLHDLVAYIRRSQRGQLWAAGNYGKKRLRACTLAADVQGIFENVLLDVSSNSLAMEPEIFERLKLSITKMSAQFFEKGILPVVLLVSADLRFALLRFLRCCNVPMPLVTFDELEPLAHVEQVGIWHLN